MDQSCYQEGFIKGLSEIFQLTANVILHAGTHLAQAS